MPLPENTKCLRTKAKLTQEQLAERCGCAMNTIWRIEAGQLRPRDGLLGRLAEALETTMGKLID
jgi:transcriptional regulator with XRE-family HTH domain